MDGIALAARFSIATNRLSYCGPAEAAPLLYRAIVDGRGDPASRAAMEGFEALVPYLRAIGAKHGLDPLDERVVEAYWLGNELLEGFRREEFRDLLDALRQRGLPRTVAERLAAHLPAEPIPHHVFHVAFVGVGAVTGHVETTLPNLEACRPTPATIVARGASTLKTVRPSLRVEGGRLLDGPEVEGEFPYDPRVVPDARPGGTVVLHWGWPALTPTAAQLASLQRYTRRALAAANESLPAMHVFDDPARR
jgi:hypothetical protein